MANPLGIHFAIGLQPSPVLTEHDRKLLEQLQPAGIILFRDNFAHGQPYDTWLRTLRELLEDVRSCIGRERLLVAIDHEGGRVIRTPEPVTHFAYAREWADKSALVGEAMGAELRSLGMNVTFAPVVDIHSNPDNPVIGPRAFATTPDAVIKAALAFIDAVEAQGVLSCPKHFPGHGDTAVDSHYGLPIVDHTLEQLRQRELLPFQAVIDAGVRMIMTSHIVFPKIDGDTPATMSHRMITNLLRGELGFQGVVVTDDIGMGAVRDMFDHADAAEKMLNAGTDIIDICAYGTDTARALQIADFIRAGVKSGRIAQHVLDGSAERVTALLKSLPQHDVVALPAEVFAQHATSAPLHDASAAGAATWQTRPK